MAKRINRDDVDKFHDYSLYIPQRTIYMGSEHISDDDFSESGTDTTMAERQIKNLLILDAISNEPVTIVMNNLGGDTMHGLAIYDAIKACRSHITIKVFGHAMSMGSVILQAADERVMAPNSVQMMHYGRCLAEGHDRTVFKQSEEFKRIDKWMEDMYLKKIREKHPTFKLGQVKKMLDHDTFLTARESVTLGLADKVLGDADEEN